MRFSRLMPSSTGRVYVFEYGGRLDVVHRSTLALVRRADDGVDGPHFRIQWRHVGEEHPVTLHLSSTSEVDDVYDALVYCEHDVVYDFVAGTDGIRHLRRTPDAP